MWNYAAKIFETCYHIFKKKLFHSFFLNLFKNLKVRLEKIRHWCFSGFLLFTFSRKNIVKVCKSRIKSKLFTSQILCTFEASCGLRPVSQRPALTSPVNVCLQREQQRSRTKAQKRYGGAADTTFIDSSFKHHSLNFTSLKGLSVAQRARNTTTKSADLSSRRWIAMATNTPLKDCYCNSKCTKTHTNHSKRLHSILYMGTSKCFFSSCRNNKRRRPHFWKTFKKGFLYIYKNRNKLFVPHMH